MNEPTLAPNVTAAANDVLKTSGILQNPYFSALADGSMSLETFRRT